MPSSKSATKPKSSTTPPEPLHEWAFEAIGTQWWIGLYQSVSAGKLAAVRQKIANRIEQFDKTYSRFRDDSLVTRIAQQAGTYHLPAEAAPLLKMYRKLYDATDGQVTPLVGQLLAEAGYDAQYSLMPGELRSVPSWDEVMTFEAGVLTTTQPLLLDFGAAGKGYLVDIIAAVLQHEGITSFCVDASGDMYCHGLSAPLKIGLENPDDPSQVIGVVNVHDQALCGSAPNRRQWSSKYHHIMNPTSLASPQHIKALWVVADTALLADGLTTALFFAEPQQLKQFEFEHAILYADGSMQCSKDFPAELFT
ncbi:MAG: FAD:protein transferase [Candidatus Saccharibacteria bacterium]|nr:FAD:protein transferase [Candidatus Saccharibacteria bacterium]